MSARFGEPHTSNFEGAPNPVYEVWARETRDDHGTVYWPEEAPWIFVGYRVLSLRQVLRHREFGYLVERSHARDRSSSPPLFPRVAATGQDQGHGMDPVPLPEPGPSGS